MFAGNPGRTCHNKKMTRSPLYVQLARTLKQEILSGIYPVGSRLPSEKCLCNKFNVSRHTARDALRLLRDDGLVISRQGAGTIVIAPRNSSSEIHQVMSVNDLMAFATETLLTIETVRMVTISDIQAKRTGLKSGEEWLEARGFRYAEDGDSPVCVAEYFIRREYAAVARILQRQTGPVFPLIEDLFGISIVEVNQKISATLATEQQAESLNVPPGSAVLEVQRAYKTGNGTIVQVTMNTHPASRFEHSMTMRRIKA